MASDLNLDPSTRREKQENDSFRRRFFAAVTDSNKLVQQFAVFAAYREIPLMVPHGGDNGGFRQGQIFFFKRSA